MASLRDNWTEPGPTGRRVRTARWGVGKRWEIRWRDAAQVQHKRRFVDEGEAKDALAELRLTPDRGQSGVTVGDMWPAWFAGAGVLKESTRDLYWREWVKHIEPRWARFPVEEVRASDVRAWVGELAVESKSVARRCMTTLHGLMKLAREDGHLDEVVTAAVRRPRPVAADVAPLDDTVVAALAEACTPHHLVVWVLVTTGVRFGEMAGFRVRDLDVARRRLRVARSITTVRSQLVTSLPKNWARRDVPVPAWLVIELDRLCKNRPPDAPLLATRSGGVWRSSSWRRIWVKARAEVGVDARVHDLRHTAACRAIERGVNLRTLQRMLGHGTLSLTADLYGRFAGDDLDSIGDLWAPPAPSADETPSGGGAGRIF